MNIFYLFLILFSSFAFAIPEDQKMNACFITINSSEEKYEFKKALESPPNKGKFNIIEFIPKGDGTDWFKKACEKKIRCDILVISGHFGGSFFGKSGKSLSLHELERNSCKDSCDGLLSSPKEVFLMGCNTLAGKDEDNRSAGEYLQVLLDDGIELSRAQEIVEQRYGAIGTSFASTMKRSFKNVPHIYGFHSIGPSGANVQFLMRKYLGKTKDYYQHLMRIEMQRSQALKGKFEAWNKENKSLAQSLRSTNFTQTSGLLVSFCNGNKTLESSDPNYELMQNLCKLIDNKINDNEKAQFISELLKRDDAELYMRHISSQIDSNSEVKGIVKSLISSDINLKPKLLKFLDKTKTGAAKIALGDLLYKLDIIDEKRFNEIEKMVAVDYLKMPVTTAAKDAICSISMNRGIRAKIDLKDIDDRIFKSVNGLAALSCVYEYDKKLIQKVFKELKRTKSVDLRASLFKILSKSSTKDNKILSYLHKQAKSKKISDKVFALHALYYLDEITEVEKGEAIFLAEGEKTIRVFNSDVELYNIFFEIIEDRNYDSIHEIAP